jgi:hypothetical protein
MLNSTITGFGCDAYLIFSQTLYFVVTVKGVKGDL